MTSLIKEHLRFLYNDEAATSDRHDSRAHCARQNPRQAYLRKNIFIGEMAVRERKTSIFRYEVMIIFYLIFRRKITSDLKLNVTFPHSRKIHEINCRGDIRKV